MTNKKPPIDTTPPKGKNLRDTSKKTDIPDADLWDHITSSVKPYHPKKQQKVDIPIPPPVTKKSKTKEKPTAKPTTTKPLPKVKTPLTDLDRHTIKKVQKEKYPIEATLDLHGMTQEKAFIKLKSFIRTSLSNNKRQLLIITGKGDKMQGVLRRMLPVWLEDSELRPYIIGITQAHIKHGGAGAFYVRLRRPK